MNLTNHPLNAEIARIVKEQRALEEEMAPLYKKREELHEALHQATIKRDTECLKDLPLEPLLPDLLLKKPPYGSVFDWRRDWSSVVALQAAHRMGFHYGIMPSGVWSDTGEARIEILKDAFKRGDLNDTIQALLPHMTPNKEGFRLFGVSHEWLIGFDGSQWWELDPHSCPYPPRPIGDTQNLRAWLFGRLKYATR